MTVASSIEIAAPASVVWDVFTDVERWPEWTPSVTTLDGPELAVGHRFEIKQPRLPRLVWVVTDLRPGQSWTWVQRSFGGQTAASHHLSVARSGHTTVHQTIDHRGALSVASGLVLARRTRRYLALEAQGLKARCENERDDPAA
jgi:uncharacterized membrane protein